MLGAYAPTRSQAVRRPRAVHASEALRLVGGYTRRHNNVGGVTAGQAPHNSSNVGVVTAGQVGHNSSICNPHRANIIQHTNINSMYNYHLLCTILHVLVHCEYDHL